jgi:hypothetical protein
MRQVAQRRTYAARSRVTTDSVADSAAESASDSVSGSAAEYEPPASAPSDGLDGMTATGGAATDRTGTNRAKRMLEDAAASVEANAEPRVEASAGPQVETNAEIQNGKTAAAFGGQALGGASAATPARSRVTAAMTDNGAAPVERMTPAGTAGAGSANMSAPLGSAPDEEDAVDRNAPPPTEAASVRTESEVASLTVPHGLMPSPLRGSLESLERQNAKLDAEGLERIEDESDLAARIADGLLVHVPESAALTVNSDLIPNHRYCRPWTARFLAELAREHETAFHKPLEVSSAVRTVEYQRRLMRTNGNAAPAEGDVVSPHLTGATVDIAKSGLSRQEMAWMRERLLALQSAGKIDVEEEFRQACFHITVYKNYAPERKTLPRHHETPSTADEAGAAQGM